MLLVFGILVFAAIAAAVWLCNYIITDQYAIPRAREKETIIWVYAVTVMCTVMLAGLTPIFADLVASVNRSQIRALIALMFMSLVVIIIRSLIKTIYLTNGPNPIKVLRATHSNRVFLILLMTPSGIYALVKLLLVGFGLSSIISIPLLIFLGLIYLNLQDNRSVITIKES